MFILVIGTEWLHTSASILSFGRSLFYRHGNGCRQDVPAFVTVAGSPAAAKMINVEGLKRRGFTQKDIETLQQAFKLLYRKHLLLDVSLEHLNALIPQSSSIQLLIDSIRCSSRGIVR